MSNPLISVIVPVYKVEKYLHNCINSVLNQSYSNWELILVNDGSPDDCPQICDDYAAKDSRVKVIHKQNGGLSDARNFGIKASSGEFLVFLDSDDYWDDILFLQGLKGLIIQNPNVDFFKEEIPLGTIGSVSLLKNKITTPFFVSNCDILIDQDYRDVYDYHVRNKNKITIVAAVKTYRIPYGVVESGENGTLESLSEKPDISYMINTGVYLLDSELIYDIPENQFFHITELIEKTRGNGGRVGCFPVSEKSWTDIGDWSEYLKYINKD